MSSFVIDPRDTLCLRDGRAATGRTMHTLPFPWPSTIAGLARTRAGLDDKQRFDTTKAELVQEHVQVRGPWLVRYKSVQDEAGELCFAAPRDCIWFGVSEGKTRVRLAPAATPPGVQTSLPDGLELVQLAADSDKALSRNKPTTGPAFWTWSELQDWLLTPTPSRAFAKDERFGVSALTTETRTHVAIDPKTLTASDGQLFSTTALRFASQGTKEREHYGIGFDCEVAPNTGLAELGERTGSVTIGGERRISMLRRSTASLPELPAGLSGRRTFRVTLLTPAIFSEGHRPKDIFGARITAAVVLRPESISGWDARNDKPKPSRRMVPAGSVYWVELPDSVDASSWLQKVWLQCISDNEQDRRDGFGLAAVGVA